MPEVDDDHEQFAVSHLVQNPIIAETVRPQSFELTVKRLARFHGISSDFLKRVYEALIELLI